MARLFVAIGGLIVLALTAALVAPYFIDWTSYRADFEREAGRILGRQVTVHGTASARLLPFPSVSFTDVSVAGVAPGETAMTVETFSMDAELAPFLRGDIHIFDMRLVRPHVLVDLAADGSLDWTVRPSVPVGAGHISLEKLTVTDGRVDLRHAASERTHHMSEINADISARALTGPWRMEGSLRLDGMMMALTASTGQVDSEGGMRLRLQARPQPYPFVLETDGNARLEDGRVRYAGNFRLNGPVAEPQPAAGTRQEPSLMRLSGAFDLDHIALAVPEFRVETGAIDDPYIAEGSAEFDLGVAPRFFVRADGAQFRLGGGKDDAAGHFSLHQRLTAFHEILRDLPRPAIPGRVELALPAIVAGDTTVRDAHIIAEPSEAGWKVESAGATLPGRTTLEAAGELTVGEEFGFAGSLLVAVGQPSGFASWLARDVDDAIRRLPAAGFSATVALKPERQTFSDLELMLGTAKFRGKLDSYTPARARPTLSLQLDGDRLDIEDMSAFASLFVSDSGKMRLSERDVELDISAGPVSAGGLSAQTLDMALRLKEERLEIDRLAIGDLEGANISATGTLHGFSVAPSGKFDASIIAADLAPLSAALAGRFADNPFAAGFWQRALVYPGLYEDASLRVVASLAGESAAGELALEAAGEMGGTTLALTARLRDAPSFSLNSPLSLVLTADGTEAPALYALLGLPALPLDFAGAAQAKLIFDGVPANAGKTTFSFTGEELAFSFEGEAGLNQKQRLSANGAGTLRADDLEPWLATSGIALPGMGFGLPASLAANIDVDDGLLVLSGLHGTVAGSTLSGDINARLRDGMPHLTGALALTELDLVPLAEMITGASALVAEPQGWPDAPFVTDAAPPVTAELELAVERLAAGTFGKAQDARLKLRLERDGISLNDVQAGMFGGTTAGFVEFRNDGGVGLLSAQISLSDVDLRQLLGNAQLTGGASLTASLTASGKSVASVIASLAGSGAASLHDLSIAGVAPQAFAALLASADTFGPQIDADSVASFAPALVRDGVFKTDGTELAFTLANGVVRAPPLRLEDGGAALSGEVRASLPEGTIAADLTLIYDAGDEALAGSEPAIRFSLAGPSDAPDVVMDTQPLAQFLTQRALEQEQQRVEAMQAALIENQRLRREVRYYSALATKREAAKQEALRLKQERQRLEQEEKRRQQEEDDARRQAAEEARIKQETLQNEAEKQAERERLDANERERLDTNRLRDEVEILLRSRQTAPAMPGWPADNALSPVMPFDLPEELNVTPRRAPRDEPFPPMGATPQVPQSIDGILRALDIEPL